MALKVSAQRFIRVETPLGRRAGRSEGGRFAGGAVSVSPTVATPRRGLGKTGDSKPMRLVSTATLGSGLNFVTYEVVRAA